MDSEVDFDAVILVSEVDLANVTVVEIIVDHYGALGEELDAELVGELDYKIVVVTPTWLKRSQSF